MNPPHRPDLQRLFQMWKEAFLASFPAQDRSPLGSELDTLEQTYLQRLDATLVATSTAVAEPGLAVTTDFAPPLPPDASSSAASDSLFSAQTLVATTLAHEPHPMPGLAGSQSSPVGRMVGDYEILDVLGRGAMGVVYKARHLTLKRVVALKMIRAGEHASERDLARFRTEAQAVARLQHPGIVQLYEVGEADGLPFFSLEYVDGPSLDKMIRGTPQPASEAAHLCQKLAEAMDHAHQHGILHRDLKPANVLLPGGFTAKGEGEAPAEPGARGSREGEAPAEPGAIGREGEAPAEPGAIGREGEAPAEPGAVGTVGPPARQEARPPDLPGSPSRSSSAVNPSSLTPKITDFGLARRIEEDMGQTRSGTILGTPSYMAPEQAEGRIREVGPLADVYSLGAILYEMLTGRPPFCGATLLETLQQVSSQEPVPPRQLNAKVPLDLETICLKCLHKDPRKRYAGAAFLAEDLGRFLANEPIHARPVGRRERLWLWCRRNPRIALLGAVVALLVVVWAGTASLLAGHLKLQKDETDRARLLADENAAEARLQATLASRNEAKAKEQAAFAAANAKRADKNAAEAQLQATLASRNATKAKEQAAFAAASAKRARDTAGVMLRQTIDLGGKLHNRLHSRRFQASPEMGRLRQDLLVILRQGLARTGERFEDVGTTPYARASVCQSLGSLLVKLGQNPEALALYQQGHALVKQVADAEPNNDLAQANLGVMDRELGNVTLQMGNARAARDHYITARDRHEKIRRNPRSGYFDQINIKRIISQDDIPLGKALLALGEFSEARRYFAEALLYRQAWSAAQPKSVEARSYIVEARMWLAITCGKLEDQKKTEEHFRAALQLQSELIRQFPNSSSFKGDLAEIQGAYGDVLLAGAKLNEADKAYGESLKNLEMRILRAPDDLSLQALLALTHERLGAVNHLRGKSMEAQTLYRKALDLRAGLAELEPGNLSWRLAHLLTLARCGESMRAGREAAELERRLGQNVVLLLQTARCYVACAAADPTRKASYTKQALAALQAATRAGYKAAALQSDPDLTALRSEPAFKSLTAPAKPQE